MITILYLIGSVSFLVGSVYSLVKVYRETGNIEFAFIVYSVGSVSFIVASVWSLS